VLISIITLKVKSNLIVEYLIILIKPIVFVHNVLLMEGKQNMWNPWYLIPKDNQGRWNASFAIMLFHIPRIECFFHLGY
jgi:hypothetical protein